MNEANDEVNETEGIVCSEMLLILVLWTVRDDGKDDDGEDNGDGADDEGMMERTSKDYDEGMTERMPVKGMIAQWR